MTLHPARRPVIDRAALKHCRHCWDRCVDCTGAWDHWGPPVKGKTNMTAWQEGHCPACAEAKSLNLAIRHLRVEAAYGLRAWMTWPKRYRTGVVRGLSVAADLAAARVEEE